MAKRRLKFADLPDTRPGPSETEEQFLERMAAHGNYGALDCYREHREAGGTFEAYREEADRT